MEAGTDGLPDGSIRAQENGACAGGSLLVSCPVILGVEAVQEMDHSKQAKLCSQWQPQLSSFHLGTSLCLSKIIKNVQIWADELEDHSEPTGKRWLTPAACLGTGEEHFSSALLLVWVPQLWWLFAGVEVTAPFSRAPGFAELLVQLLTSE